MSERSSRRRPGALDAKGSGPIETSLIRKEALTLGFDAVGFTTPALAASDRHNLFNYLDDGRHGDMTWLDTRAHLRCDPKGLWPEARSVICLGLNYGPHEDPLAALQSPDAGAISVYARGRDYHAVLKSKLKTLGRWLTATFGGAVKVFADTAPVMEKPLARRAGLGWIGKHTNLVSRSFGSWLFLGEVFTTLSLAPDQAHPDHCGRCRACIEACPTGAITAPNRIDPRRCLSYLTIEHKSTIRGDLSSAWGNRVFGCDDCLAACPWNKFARRSPHGAFAPRPGLDRPALAAFADLDDDTFRTRFAGTAIKRTGRDRFVRNVAHAMANATAPSAQPILERLSTDTSTLVADAATASLVARRIASAG